MCECSCGNSDPSHRLPGPDGIIYTVEVYPGCRDCGLVAVVTLTRLDEEQARAWEVDKLPEVPFSDCGQAHLPVLDAKVLGRRLVEFHEKNWHLHEYDPGGPIEDGLRDHFSAAVTETVEGSDR